MLLPATTQGEGGQGGGGEGGLGKRAADAHMQADINCSPLPLHQCYA